MLPLTEKGLDRGARFIYSAKQQPIGKITQRRRQKLVQIDISDERDQRLFTVADNMSQRGQAMMKAFLTGGFNEVLATTQPLRFTQPGQSVGFELQPTDNFGNLELTLSAPETTPETEICVLLGVTVLMYWWGSDRSS
ncbi:MAG: hypothetical protein HC889_19365 [Synechococcaceae cyanobacterium SM1_2_3]|nr:hypothetical protein [Synechococcaceae cyanobacterium SM1_2_3]